MAVFGVNKDKKDAKLYQREQKKRAREDESIRSAKLRRIRHENVERGLGIGRIIFFIMLFAVFMRVIVGAENDITLFGFLEYLTTAPQIDPDWLVLPQITVDVPNWLDWAKDFVNLVVTTNNVVGYFAKGLVNFILMATWGLGYIFG